MLNSYRTSGRVMAHRFVVGLAASMLLVISSCASDPVGHSKTTTKTTTETPTEKTTVTETHEKNTTITPH